MVKITPLIASLLLSMVAAQGQEQGVAPSATGAPAAVGSGSFGGFGQGGQGQHSGFPGAGGFSGSAAFPQPTGGFGGNSGGFGGHGGSGSAALQPTGGFGGQGQQAQPSGGEISSFQVIRLLLCTRLTDCNRTCWKRKLRRFLWLCGIPSAHWWLRRQSGWSGGPA